MYAEDLVETGHPKDVIDPRVQPAELEITSLPSGCTPGRDQYPQSPAVDVTDQFHVHHQADVPRSCKFA
jgi:hypothetical protein